MDVRFRRVLPGGEEETTGSFTSPPVEMYNSVDVQESIADSLEAILLKIDGFIRLGSGWRLEHIISGSVHSSSFDCIGGSGYLATPKKILLKKAIRNIKNTDDRCLFYCMIAEKHKEEFKNKNHLENPKLYEKYFGELNTAGITCPVQIDQLTKVERLNPDYSLNVVYYDDEINKIVPIHVSKSDDRPTHVNMLLITGQNE